MDARFAKQIIEHTSGNWRAGIIYFDPFDMNHPAGLNVLRGVPADDRQRLTENICAYFEAMRPNGWAPNRTTFWQTAFAYFWILRTQRFLERGPFHAIAVQIRDVNCTTALDCRPPSVPNSWDHFLRRRTQRVSILCTIASTASAAPTFPFPLPPPIGT
jgi:hypothetical protein